MVLAIEQGRIARDFEHVEGVATRVHLEVGGSATPVGGIGTLDRGTARRRRSGSSRSGSGARRRNINRKWLLILEALVIQPCHEEIWRLSRRHAGNDLIVEVVIGASESTVVPDLKKVPRKKSVSVAISRELVILATGYQQH